MLRPRTRERGFVAALLTERVPGVIVTWACCPATIPDEASVSAAASIDRGEIWRVDWA